MNYLDKFPSDISIFIFDNFLNIRDKINLNLAKDKFEKIRFIHDSDIVKIKLNNMIYL